VKKIYGYYFIAAINSFKELVIEQTQRLFSSELFSKTDKLFIRIYYEKTEDQEFLVNYFNSFQKIELSFTNQNEFEFGTLNMIKNMSNLDDFYCYYFHTKGVSITQENYKKYKVNDFEVLKQNVDSWRKIMEYFLIEKFKENVNKLGTKVDCVGINLKPTPKTEFYHYSGNFWWSKSSYIKKIPSINTLNLTYRWDAEFWLGYASGNMFSYPFGKKIGYKHRVYVDDYRI
jgi:hypothetical protein